MTIHSCVLLCLFAAVSAARAEFSPDDLRVYRFESDAFDYVFTSYAEASGKTPILSFNHRSGQTCFARRGEKVGEHTLAAFEPSTADVFDPTVNATRRTKAGRATLRAPDGKDVVLEMGKLGLLSGSRALIVSLKTGSRWSVRTGDSFVDSGSAFAVESIADPLVSLTVDGTRKAVIPLATDDEKVAVFLVWKGQREEREKQEAARLAAAAPAVGVVAGGAQAAGGGGGGQVAVANAGALNAGRVTGVAGSEPRLFVGTEYRYPTEYEIWLIRQGKEGRYQPMVIPKKFETRTVGGSIGPGPDFSWTTVAPPGSSHYPTGTPRGDSPMVPYPQTRFSRTEYKINR